jgi:hypothetical protein
VLAHLTAETRSLKKEKALRYFRGVEQYNCAQAILKAFQDEYGIPQKKIDEFAAFGGGRAKEGVCGALFAGQEIFDEDTRKQSLERAFSNAAGSSKCREIRKMNQLSCGECVELTAELLEKMQD